MKSKLEFVENLKKSSDFATTTVILNIILVNLALCLKLKSQIPLLSNWQNTQSQTCLIQ